MVELVQVLRGLHLAFAIAWMGGALYRSHVVGTSLRDGRFADRFYADGRHGPFMGITATGTVVFGGALMGLNSDAYSLDAIQNGAWILGSGMGLAMLAYGVGIFGHVPNDKRLKELAASRLGSNTDEDAYAMAVAKDHLLGRISLGLMTGALLTMLVFRWF